MNLEEILIIKSDVPDNAQSVGNNAEFKNSEEIRRIAFKLTVIAAAETNVKEEQEDIRHSIENFHVRREGVDKALDARNKEIQNYRMGLNVSVIIQLSKTELIS